VRVVLVLEVELVQLGQIELVQEVVVAEELTRAVLALLGKALLVVLVGIFTQPLPLPAPS
jgi:hypothetical protein